MGPIERFIKFLKEEGYISVMTAIIAPKASVEDLKLWLSERRPESYIVDLMGRESNQLAEDSCLSLHAWATLDAKWRDYEE